MPRRIRTASPLARVGASAAVLAAIVGSASLVLSQTPPTRTVVYSSQVAAPLGASEADVAPPPTLFDVRDAIAGARSVGETAARAATAAVPEVPWGRWGLARVPIDPDAMRLDEARNRYVVDLPDGAVAVLTLDVELQQRIRVAVGRYEEPGEAIVAIEPSTGRVLGMVDDSARSDVGDGLARRAYAYAASTFKVVTGAALIGEGYATPQTETCYHGGGSSVELAHLDESPDDTSCVTLSTAMATSANVVFARLADRHLDPATLQGWAERLGYNARIPFEAPLEISRAELPDSRLRFAQSAAGFRYSWLSPLHGALIEAAIANDGTMMVPALVERIEEADGTIRYAHEPVVWREAMSADLARQLRETQLPTCSTGTARSYFGQRDGFPASITAWGKTGTLSNRSVDGDDPANIYTYTWFIGAGEADGREVAVSGLAVNSDLWWVKGGFLASEAVLGALAD